MAFVAAAVGAVISGGFQAYMNHRAMIESRKEARRTEKLQKKFFEISRGDSNRQFARSTKLKETELAQSRAAQRVNTTQSIFGSMQGMFANNEQQGMNIMKFNQGRA